MCPSSSFRRVAGIAAVSIFLGASAGALGVFALAPRPDSAAERALNIVFAQEAPAAPVVTGTTSSSFGPLQVVSSQAAGRNAAAQGKEPKLSGKKRKKIMQSRLRRHEGELAETRDRGTFASPFGRFEQTDRLRGWN